jgi:kynurenine formamidase
VAFFKLYGGSVFGELRAVDLTHRLDGDVPSWTGGCGFKYDVKLDYDAGVRVLKYTMHAGVGTHMDSPLHFFPDGRDFCDIPLEMCMAPACVLDMRGRDNPDLMISVKDVREYEKEHGKIAKGSLVLASTGWEERWNHAENYRNVQDDGQMHFPGFSGEAAELLVDRGIVGLGIDTLSPDGSNQDDFPVHHAVLGAGSYILENLMGLSKVPPKGAHVLALPPKVAEGTEVMLRVVGLCPKEGK